MEFAMQAVSEDDFREIVSQWRDKRSVVEVMILYPDSRTRSFSCSVQEVSKTDVILITEDGWLRIFPFGNATYHYDTPDHAPERIRASVSEKFNSALFVNWKKGDMWLMAEANKALPGARPVTTSDSN